VTEEADKDMHSRLMPGLRSSLSARLLLLTVLFVMIAEVFAFAPSVGRAQRDFLLQKLSDAKLAILALEASPDQQLSPDLRDRMLEYADAQLIAFRLPNGARMAIIRDMPDAMAVTVDLHDGNFATRIYEAFRTLFASEPYRTLRILGSSPQDRKDRLEIVISEEPVVLYLRGYAWRIFLVSLAISIFTAALVFMSLHFAFANPVRRLTQAIVRFREDPEDKSRALEMTERADEIGIAQNELAEMQDTVRKSMQQQSRLAALGTGVAKINHDLRNMLATTLLLSERLETSDDADVRKMAPNFIASIERAVNICSNTLRFAKDDAPFLNPTMFSLFGLIDEVGEQKVRGEKKSFERLMQWDNDVDLRLALNADYDHMFRVVDNLVRNAFEAGATALSFTTEKNDIGLLLSIKDNGPGLPEKARANLFKAFTGSAKKGGTGLGLVIARDTLRAMDGDLRLEHTSTDGTVFTLLFPSSVVS
jgi:signal transduction histidine kinase